ncbi:MAG: hypothetical protein IJ158_01000 [Treponema sp.]|nr:hypothetical protein [Treponema sp.]
MKKILSVVGAVAVLTSALFVASCSGEYGDIAADTVISVGAPSVKAVAYPGVNYLTWNVVPKASAYEVYRKAEGESGETYLGNLNAPSTANTTLEFADIANAKNELTDGVNYTYKVIAFSKATTASNAREIYFENATGSASVKATVPALTSAITEWDYAKDYLAALDAKTGVVTNKDDSTTTAKLVVSYPSLAGLKYGIKFAKESAIATGTSSKSSTTASYKVPKDSKSGYYIADYSGNVTTGAGAYHAYLTVEPVSPLYLTYAVKDLGTITVDALNEATATGDTDANYTSATTARIVWTPAKDSYGNRFETTDYTVFRQSAKEAEPTVLKDVEVVKGQGTSTSSAISADGNVVYYIDDTIDDNTVKYTYTIVLAKDGRYGSSATATLNAYAKSAQPTVNVTSGSTGTSPNLSLDADGLYNDVKIEITLPTPNVEGAAQKIAIDYLKVEDNSQVAKASFETIELDNLAGDVTLEGSTYTIYKKNLEPGTYLFRVTNTEEGRAKSNAVYKTSTVAGIDEDVLVSGVDLSLTSNADDPAKQDLVFYENFAGDSLANYSFKLYTVTTTTTTTSGALSSYDTVKTESSVPSVAARASTATGYQAYNVLTNITPNTTSTVDISYVLVKTRKAASN